MGQIADGMHRAGWDLQLTEYGDGHWRATFYVTGAGALDRGPDGVGGYGVDGGPAPSVGRA